MPLVKMPRKPTGVVSSEARKNKNASIDAVDRQHGILIIRFLMQSVM
jgi:hypothetical protein